jgi:hypothetical protein
MPKARTTWITVVGITLVAGVIVLIVWHFGSPPVDDPLAGFTLLDLPRADVKLGSIWTDGVGPTRRLTDVLQTTTRSLDADQIRAVGRVHAGIFASLAKSLHLSVSGSREASRLLKLKGLAIETVADSSKLPSLAGNQYIWEAVRADQFSMIASRADEASARSRMQDATGANKIEARATGSDSLELTAEGSKLIVAYRVVTISQPTLDRLDETPVLDLVSDVNVGKGYSLHFAPVLKAATRKSSARGTSRKEYKTNFDEDCTVTMTVTTFRNLDEKKPIAFQIPCAQLMTTTYALGSTSGSTLATIDALSTRDLLASPMEGGVARAKGTFAIERRTIQLQTLNNPRAPGW